MSNPTGDNAMTDDNKGGAGNEEGGSGQGDNAPGTIAVVVNGETIQVSQEDLVTGYQQNSSYTQKSQALSSKETDINKHIEDKAVELYLKALAEGKESGGEGSSGGAGSEGDDADVTSKELAKIRAELAEAKQEFANDKSDTELNGIMSGLAKQFPRMDQEKVKLRFSREAKEHDNVSDTFGRIAKEDHERAVAYDKALIEEYVKTKRVPYASGETGHAGAGTPNKPAEPAKTFAEARERAEARLRG